MANYPTKTRLLGALALPFLIGLGTTATVASCSNSSDEDDGSSLGKGVHEIVYIVRQHTTIEADGTVNINVAGGQNQVVDYLRYVPGGRIELKSLSSGKVDNILEGFPTADVSSMEISFDATRIVFSMKKDSDDDYHIYIAELKRIDGAFPIRQLTFGPYDDMYPIFVAARKIAFVTNQGYTSMGTRADEYNHGRVVTQLAVMSETAGDAERRLCSQNLSHTVNLFALKDGRVGFSRWEHVGPVNDVKVFAMNPDCTQMVAIAGQHGKPGSVLVQLSESNTPNVFMAITTKRNKTIQAGALVTIDARAPGDPARFYEEEPIYDVLTPSVPRDSEPSPIGRYRYPVSLPDGRILVSWAAGMVNDLSELSLTPPDFGLYIYDPKTRQNRLVVNYEDSWEMYGRAVVPREVPPIIAPIQNASDATVATKFGSIDIKQTSLASIHGQTVSGAQFDGTPVDEALKQAVQVRIIEGFSSEAAPGTRMFGLTRHEGAAMLGEATIEADGSWLADLPPFIPVRMQPIDKFGLAIRSQMTWLQGMPGEDRVCGGCHEPRNKPIPLGNQPLTTAAGRGAENMNLPISDRVELPWLNADAPFKANEVQELLTAKCANCHNESTNGNGPQEFYTVTMTVGGVSTPYQIPRMDLSSREITVRFNNEIKPYAASHVSIFYPEASGSTIEDSTVTGTLPPLWGVTGSARESALIEKINAVPEGGGNETAWKLGDPFSDASIKGGTRTLHPENVGVTLTRDERMMLIRSIDMGGQYEARQNNGFQPYADDPLKKQY